MIINAMGIYKDAKNQYFARKEEIRTDKNLSVEGKENEGKKASAKFQSVLNGIVETSVKKMQDFERQLQFYTLPAPTPPDSETIIQLDYEFKSFVSRVSVTDNNDQFLKAVSDMGQGSELQRRALMLNFSQVLQIADNRIIQTAKTVNEGIGDIWDSTDPVRENRRDVEIQGVKNRINAKLKEMYTLTETSLKTEKEKKYALQKEEVRGT